MAYDNEEKK